MKVNKYDVAIIGGGISGLTLAKFLAEEKVNFILLEEDGRFGIKPCGEGITPSLGKYSFYELYESRKGIERTYERMAVEIGGNKVFLRIPNIICNKHKVEGELARQAVKKGAEIVKKSRVRKIERVGKHFLLLPQNIYCKILVGADGVKSITREYLGIKPPNFALAAAGILKRKQKEDYYTIKIVPKITRLGYLWEFPKLNTINVGGGSIEVRSIQRILNFLKREYPHVDFKVHPIPMGKPTRSYGKSILLVGDAAGQVIPPFGDGILPSMICSKIASEVISKASRNNFRKIDFSIYEKRWREELGTYFKVGFILLKSLQLAIRSERTVSYTHLTLPTN